MHADVERTGRLEHRVEAARALGRWDFDAVHRAVREPLVGVRQIVEISLRQRQRAKEGTDRHRVDPTM
jgi:hypothetical protein